MLVSVKSLLEYLHRVQNETANLKCDASSMHMPRNFLQNLDIINSGMLKFKNLVVAELCENCVFPQGCVLILTMNFVSTSLD